MIRSILNVVYGIFKFATSSIVVGLVCCAILLVAVIALRTVDNRLPGGMYPYIIFIGIVIAFFKRHMDKRAKQP